MYASLRPSVKAAQPDHRQRRIRAGNQPLRARFFVARCAVDLSGEKQTRSRAWFRATLVSSVGCTKSYSTA